jgi:hypothetical protein
MILKVLEKRVPHTNVFKIIILVLKMLDEIVQMKMEV